ncbi:MAG: hypothetical protein KDA80_22045 [Planctomycetaceae bacterium]|nr:hypothetical protein [Planctomycetaceae bacterium]
MNWKDLQEFTRDDLLQLAETPGPVATILLPMVESGPDVRQNHLKFKNALKSLQQQSGEDDSANWPSQISQLEPLIDNDDFWQHQSPGLACFLMNDEVKAYRLTTSPMETVFSGDAPGLAPLVSEIDGKQQFFVIAVSENNTRLLKCFGTQVEQVKPKGLPESLDEIRPGETGKGFGLHSFRPADGMGDRATPHGHERADEEEMVRRYFRAIDVAISEEISNRETTVVFAGVEELFPFYKEVSELKSLYPEPLTGNFEHSSDQEIRDAAKELLHRSSANEAEEWKEKIGAAKAADHCVEGVSEISQAAQQGAVASLVLSNEHVCGASHDGQNPIHGCVSAVLNQGGTIEFLSGEAVNLSQPVAVLRYPVSQTTTT